MNYSIILPLLIMGLREIFNTILLLFVFKGYLRLSIPKTTAIYVLVYVIECSVALWRGSFYAPYELYAIGLMRILLFLAITRLSPSRSLFMGFFLIYACILTYNVAYTLPSLLRLGAYTFYCELLLYLLGTVLAFSLCRRFFQRFQQTIIAPGNQRLLVITDLIMLSYLLAIASQKGFAKVFDWYHLCSRLLIVVPAMLFMLVVLMLLEEINNNKELNQGLIQLGDLYNKEKSYHQQLLQHKNQEKELHERLEQDIFKVEQLLDQRDYQALEKHFDRLLERSDKLQRIVLSGNQVIDAVVGYWRMRCLEKNIPWQSEINIDQIQIDDMDLAIVLGNALENAYTALTAPAGPAPSIQLKITTKSNFLLIALTNSFNGALHCQNGEYYSAKRGFAKPGTGIANIKLLAEKYQGYVNITTEDKLFKLQLALNNRRQAP